MPWDEQRYERFVDATIRMARGELPGYGYPHVVLPYPPREELRCIDELQRLPGRLSPLGLLARRVALAPFVARALRRFSERPLRDGDEYQRLERDLADPSVGLVPMVTELLHRELSLAADTVLVLGRLGALYPFAHVSSFLDGLFRVGIRNTVAVLYPGTADSARLRFLGLVDPTGGYRGHVVT